MTKDNVKTFIENRTFHILALIILVTIAYFGIWNSYFNTGDDFRLTGLIKQRPTLFEAAKGLDNGVRFLNYAMIWVKTRLFDVNAAPYFWSSLIQHLIVSVIVYLLVSFWAKRYLIGFLTALLFSVKYSYYEIVTSVSASDYSVWAIFYLSTIACFTIYLERRKIGWYLAAIGMYLILALAHDFTLSIPLVLLAYHFTLGRASRPITSLKWSDFKIHIPIWIIWSIHVSIQFYYVVTGTSEVIYSDHAYVPGLHMITNIYYLVHLILPRPPTSFLIQLIGEGGLPIFASLSTVLAIATHVFLAVCFWRGSQLVKFAVAFTYIPFLQYTLWQGGFAGALRYLYLPSIGFSLLIALLLTQLADYLYANKKPIYNFLVPGLVGLIVIVNIVVIQIWVQRNNESGDLRRAFVTQLAKEYSDVGKGSKILIEVPRDRYEDLDQACFLVIKELVECQVFVTGEKSSEKAANSFTENEADYWLRATQEGLEQIYPTLDSVQQ